jgi:hypothetical protein
MRAQVVSKFPNYESYAHITMGFFFVCVMLETEPKTLHITQML